MYKLIKDKIIDILNINNKEYLKYSNLKLDMNNTIIFTINSKYKFYDKNRNYYFIVEYINSVDYLIDKDLFEINYYECKYTEVDGSDIFDRQYITKNIDFKFFIQNECYSIILHKLYKYIKSDKKYYIHDINDIDVECIHFEISNINIRLNKRNIDYYSKLFNKTYVSLNINFKGKKQYELYKILSDEYRWNVLSEKNKEFKKDAEYINKINNYILKSDNMLILRKFFNYFSIDFNMYELLY